MFYQIFDIVNYKQKLVFVRVKITVACWGYVSIFPLVLSLANLLDNSLN